MLVVFNHRLINEIFDFKVSKLRLKVSFAGPVRLYLILTHYGTGDYYES